MEKKGLEEYSLQYSNINGESVIHKNNMADAVRCLNVILSMGNRVNDLYYGVNIYKYIMEDDSIIDTIRNDIKNQLNKYVPNITINGVELSIGKIEDGVSSNKIKALSVGISIKDTTTETGYRNITFVINPDKNGNVSGRIVDV